MDFNDPNTVQILTNAAQTLMAPPNVVSAEERRQAESVMLEFRTSSFPYQMCRQILENCNIELLNFEAVGLIKSAIIREWSLLSQADKLSLRQFLLNYVMERDVPSFLIGKILQTIAIMVKRSSIDDLGQERHAILTEIENIIMNSPFKQQRIACCFIQALLQEFAITVKSADVGLIWETHFELKKQFEMKELKRIFRFASDVLRRLLQTGSPAEGEISILLKHLLSICEAILCWGQLSHVLPKRLRGALEAMFIIDNPALRLNLTWRDTILQSELLSLFFNLHMWVRQNPDLVGTSITCLVQLASLSGAVVSEPTIRINYLENYVNNLLIFLRNVEPNEREMMGVADISGKLVYFFSAAMLAKMDVDFINQIARWTCMCIRAAVNEESTNEDTVWNESLNLFFTTWRNILLDSEAFTDEILQRPAIEIFNTYLQSRLGPPDGTRGIESCLEEIREDLEEDERELHSSALIVIGDLGRKATEHSLGVLTALLTQRLQILEEQLKYIQHTGKVPPNCETQFITLFEDLHWILMITGNLLAVDSKDSEVTLIPQEIIKYSISENADPNKSISFLTGESNSDEGVDPVIRVIALILRVADAEVTCLDAGLSSIFSPELSATISWLFTMWSQAYLGTKLSEYTMISGPLETLLGAGISWWCSRCICRVVTVLQHLYSQRVAATRATSLLIRLATLSNKTTSLAQCEEFIKLVEWENSNNKLPSDIKRDLHKAFVLASNGSEGEQRMRMLRATLTLLPRLKEMMLHDTEPHRNVLIDVLESLSGVAEVGFDDQEFNMQVLQTIPLIVDQFHNYQSVVLPCFQLLNNYALHVLHLFSPDNSNRFFEVCMGVIELYVGWNTGRLSELTKDADEDNYQDVRALLELVRNISCSVGGSACGARALLCVLPLVTAALLTLPTLVHALYTALKDYPATQVTLITAEQFTMLVHAVRIGLTVVASDVSNLCCESIIVFANQVKTLPEQDPKKQELLSLIEIILVMVMKLELTPESVPSVSPALYGLVCLDPNVFQNIIRNLIQAFSERNPNSTLKLEQAFTNLTRDIIFDGQRQSKLKFRDNFEKFSICIQGFLIVK